MDLTKTGVTPNEILSMMDDERVYFIPEYARWSLYTRLLEWIKSDELVLVCVASSMTSRVAYHLFSPEDIVDDESRRKKREKMPLPVNFRINGTCIEFDFPDTVEVDKPEGKVVLKFDQLMMDFIERAGGLSEGSLRTINPCKIDELSFDGEYFTLGVRVDDIDREWFKFALLSRNGLDKALAASDGDRKEDVNG